MTVRPIASFAAAAAASGASQNANAATGSLSNAPAMDPTAPSIAPRAVIPAMEEIGLGSGVGSDGGFDLTGAPFQPVEQRFAFPPGSESSIESGAAFGASGISADRPAPNWAANFAAGNGSAPATLPHPDQIAHLKPLGQVSSSFIVAVNDEGLWLVDQHVAHHHLLL